MRLRPSTAQERDDAVAVTSALGIMLHPLRRRRVPVAEKPLMLTLADVLIQIPWALHEETARFVKLARALVLTTTPL